MIQRELDAAVASATGESVRTIARRGFSLVVPGRADLEDPPVDPQVLDWDALQRGRPINSGLRDVVDVSCV